MIGFLKGEVYEVTEKTLILMTNGVGYEVYVGTFLASTLSVGQDVSLHIYTHVREDLFQLFGFVRPEEKKLFLLLITVNGVGPKSAMDILGHDPNFVIQSLAAGDVAAMTSLPGVGKKTAERLVLDLQEKVIPLAGSTFREQSTAGQVRASAVDTDIVEALVSLGYDGKHVQRTLERISQEHMLETMTQEDIVRLALKFL